jgi:hypothetical protein
MISIPNQAWLAAVALAGVIGGLGILARGFAGYRAAGRISGTAVSRIASLAVGEVLVSGTAEPVELTLISPLQSVPCLYYRSKVTDNSDGEGGDLFREERAVGFRVRDVSGTVRVFPRGARFDVPDRFDATSGGFTVDPIGLRPRTGDVYAPGPDDREARIAELLTVHQPGPASLFDPSGLPVRLSQGRLRFREARIEPGDLVTILGQVLPFADLPDPANANLVDGTDVEADDPEIAADLEAARAAGQLTSSPEKAWGNAAIEGFGIGRPVRAPDLDPLANPLPLADPETAAKVAATFAIAPEALVLAAADGDPLGIALGAPSLAAARQEWRFVVGLFGAVLSIGSAVLLGAVMNGALK